MTDWMKVEIKMAQIWFGAATTDTSSGLAVAYIDSKEDGSESVEGEAKNTSVVENMGDRGSKFSEFGKANSYEQRIGIEHLLRDLEPKTLNELLRDDLPRWVKFPDVEKCEWLNKVIAGMWPYAKLVLARSMKEALEVVLNLPLG
ncbi:hypothetical protein JG687_00004758 [Phytophthora cactorum]|uniref:Uncharacterized protein n=1 Tax=Phytophthora cactorum TaxID=29920 RepID=A0A8T1USH2_9STRA|nr:hypothetical protein JG687_00004758 [Phytophthora cactorum]